VHRGSGSRLAPGNGLEIQESNTYKESDMAGRPQDGRGGGKGIPGGGGGNRNNGPCKGSGPGGGAGGGRGGGKGR